MDDIEIWSHTNDSLGSVRRQILNRTIKSANIAAIMKVDLFHNTELIDPSEDKKLISQIPLRDKTVGIYYVTLQIFISILPHEEVFKILSLNHR